MKSEKNIKVKLLFKTIGIIITNYEVEELKEKWARDEGKEEGRIEIAKKLKEMDMKLENIQKATGLEIEEIEKL